MNQAIQTYHHALCPGGMPGFLAPYLHTPPMARLQGVGLFCGTDYTRLYRHSAFYSRFDHSLGVALIVWRFTGDRAQTLAGLLHDLSTPVFSHSVDFMNGDAATQTSTEAKNGEMIRNSQEIRALLARDGIPVQDVEDYHAYPIADNDSPRLSADRLEYTLSTGLYWADLWRIADVARMYESLTVQPNESGEPEMCFDDPQSAQAFALGAAHVCKLYQMNENKVALSMLGDILKMGIERGLFSPDHLYQMTEAQAIALLKSGPGPIASAWAAFASMERIARSHNAIAGRYSVKVDAKRRYINPLCQTATGVRRVYDVSDAARRAIDDLLSFQDAPYGVADFALM